MINSPFFVDEQSFYPIKIKKKFPIRDSWANFEDWVVVTKIPFETKDKWIKHYLIREYNDYDLKDFPMIINLDGEYIADDFKLTNLIELSRHKEFCTIKIEFSTMNAQIVGKSEIRELTLKNIL